MKLAVIGLCLLGSTASAGPTARFGVTGGLADQSGPQAGELGPLVAIGERVGAFVVEVDYAYMSFFGASLDHRIGLNLRADLFQLGSDPCHLTYACTRGRTIFGELGSAERFGHVAIDAAHLSPIDTRQPEAHIGIGLELQNQLVPHRNGWQLGLRFAIANGEPSLGTACRGSTCTPTTGAIGGVNTSVFFEWMYFLGN